MAVHLIANRDASQFIVVGISSDGRVEVKCIVDGGKPPGLKSCHKTTALWPILINTFADSLSGPPVYVIADANLPADAIDCYTIPGLVL